jgi:long-chain-fatty-acid--[acyl-carrier-protein] ligase
MMGLLRWCLWGLSRFVLWLRYSVTIKGAEKLRGLKGPFLVLPNHPAYMDPPNVLTHMFPLLAPRPLLFEDNFKNPLLYPLMALMNAIRVPNLSQASVEARERANKAIEDVKAALQRGENVVLWPAGKLERAGAEKLGAARTLSDVLKAVPDVKLVLLRTTGLWGSSFSYAWDGTPPPFLTRLLQGLGVLCANLLFFTPRRQVEMRLEVMEPSQLPGLEREVLNPFLEQWYNPGGVPDTPVFVPYHFLFGAASRDYPALASSEEVDLSSVKPETKAAVDEMLEAMLKSHGSHGPIGPDTHLDALGLDSLDRQELSLKIEKRFLFHGDTVPATVGELYALASGLARREPPRPPSSAWFTPPSGSLKPEVLGDTIAEAFVTRALACRRDVAVADDRAGVMSYERLLVASLIMSRRIRELPGDAVGVLMPASVGCDVALLGCYLAGKLPVVLNWTTGQANLAHAARIMSLQRVLTSRAVVDRLGIDVPGATFVFLEDLGKTVSSWEKLTTLLTVKWLPGSVRSGVPRKSPDDPAVVLFTSGSEKAPKAVPLTHRNLLTNMKDVLALVDIDRRHSMLGFLPAFHSFGMSVTGLLPILAGIRVARHPDPTDAAALARKCGSYKTTILVGTPTFVNYILERAEKGELASVELAVVGAEKCPDAVFKAMAEAAPRSVVVEGYGITECSPVVAANPPRATRAGTVGKPLRSVEARVVRLDAENHPLVDQEAPPGQMGMLLVAGPTIFPGYIGHEGESPFREWGGKKWYVTGDLVQLDAEGYIVFSGRLKRFIKAGGEMISLPALEEPFARLYPPTKDGPRVAVEGIEIEGGGRKVVLFTTEDTTLREANDYLVKEGMHGVMRLDEVRKVDKLPVLGTGKTDYKVLRAEIQA